MNEFGLFLTNPWEVDSFRQLLPSVHMKGGGGGSSGKVSYPAYMETKHSAWLDDLDTLITGTTSPFTGAITWDPDLTLAAMADSVGAFSTAVSNISSIDDWQAAIATAKTKWDSILSDTELNDDVKAFGDLLEDDLNEHTVAQFETGMRDVNAIMTSAFVMGKARLWSGKTKEVAKYSTALRLQAAQTKAQLIDGGAKTILDGDKTKLTMEESLARLSIENYRMKIVAKTEECQRQFELDEKDARWPLDLYQYGVDMLGGIGGGTVGAGRKQSTAQSALGGALSGAATGMAMSGGNPLGGIIGGVLGLGASLF